MSLNQDFPLLNQEEWDGFTNRARIYGAQGNFLQAETEYRNALKRLLIPDQLSALLDSPPAVQLQPAGPASRTPPPAPAETPYAWLTGEARIRVTDCLTGMAECLRSADNTRAALPFAERATLLDPNRHQAWITLGFCLNAEFEFRRALAAFQAAMAAAGPDGSLWYNIGQANFRLHRFRDAERALKESLKFNQNEYQPYYYIGLILKTEGNFEGAEASFRQAFDCASARGIDSLFSFSRLCDEDGVADWEEKAADECIDRDPFSDIALRMKALVKQHAGEFAEAESYLKTAIQWNPENGDLYQDIATGRKMTPEDLPFLEEIEQKLRSPGLNLETQRALNYALGKGYDDLKEYKKAMKHFDLANHCARTQVGVTALDLPTYHHFIDEVIRFNTPERIAQWAKYGSDSQKPILIVGMIRSGTTLCEQIISSHPDVGGAGELQYLRTRTFWKQNNASESEMKESIEEFAQDYLDLLASYAPNSPRVTDKMPLNYANLGLAAIAFPHAKIIHMRRSPFDTCLSMYVTPFTPNLNYGHDQDSIVEFYKGYLKLMSHWRQVLSPDQFLEVNYEDIVADKEAQLRRMTSFLGLAWDESLLSHSENRRDIHTPSQWQARQPIYKTSVNRFQNYEPYLGGLKKLMEPGFLESLRQEASTP